MASCEICGIGPIPSPCIIICWDDCRVCGVHFASQTTKVVVDVDSDVWKAGKPPQLDGSKRIQFCCKGVTSAQIAEFMNKVCPAARYRSAKAGGTISETMTGALGEIMKKLGLES